MSLRTCPPKSVDYGAANVDNYAIIMDYRPIHAIIDPPDSNNFGASQRPSPDGNKLSTSQGDLCTSR